MVTARGIFSQFGKGNLPGLQFDDMDRKLQVVGNCDGLTMLTINGFIQSAPIANR